MVPTTYVPARGKPVQTNQYSVTHYTRELEHDRGTPGIFFKFDMEPLNMRVEQRTTTLIQFLIRYGILNSPLSKISEFMHLLVSSASSEASGAASAGHCASATKRTMSQPAQTARQVSSQPKRPAHPPNANGAAESFAPASRDKATPGL